MRQDYKQFIDREAEVVVVGPENTLEFKDYWEEKDLPFIGLPDPRHTVLKRYGQEISLFKLGRMPAQLIVDKSGRVRFVHYGQSMRDIPTNEELLETLDHLNQENSLVTASLRSRK